MGREIHPGTFVVMVLLVIFGLYYFTASFSPTVESNKILMEDIH